MYVAHRSEDMPALATTPSSTQHAGNAQGIAIFKALACQIGTFQIFRGSNTFCQSSSKPLSSNEEARVLLASRRFAPPFRC
mmetsp:Transcript_53894/g.94106  ORF Transcript_53894/g.94106 Transcript_53894/m.94106 type:complete len:81 (+) Transcript_53894:27-269(+)